MLPQTPLHELKQATEVSLLIWQETENPEDDEESDSPEGEEETENPEDDEESEGPEGEEETENPEGGEESETLEEETENPEESGESEGLEGKEDIENPEKDIDVEPTLDNKLDDIKDAAYEGRDAEGNMTPEAKEKLVDDMKQAYDDTPKEDRGDTLVPEKSEYLKDPPIAENKNTGERYNDVNYDWPSNGGFEGKPEEVAPQVGDRFDRVGAENGRYVAPIEGDTPQPVENRGLPYHFTEDNITDEPSYHSYEVGVVDEVYMRIFENCRGKKPGQEVSSRCSTDMEALRKQKRAM